MAARFCYVLFGSFCDFLRQLTGSAPTILIVPAYLHIRGSDIAPPRLKVLTRNVERRGREQMIEHYRVLLAPAKSRNGTQVIVVKETLGE
jgi:hypothetical protein